MPNTSHLGRGEIAVSDMKARIAKLREDDADIIDALWERHFRAETLGEGYTYEFADPAVEDEPR